MDERVAEMEMEASRMPLRPTHELLNLRWRCSDLTSEIEYILPTDKIVAAKKELADCEARIKEIEELLALTGSGPCAPALEMVPAGEAALVPSGSESALLR